MADSNTNLLTTFFQILGADGRKKLEDDIKSGNRERIQAAQDQMNAGLQALASNSNTVAARDLGDLRGLQETLLEGTRAGNKETIRYTTEVEDLAARKSERQARQIVDINKPLLDMEYGAMAERDQNRTNMFDDQLAYDRARDNKQLIRDLVLGGMFMFG